MLKNYVSEIVGTKPYSIFKGLLTKKKIDVKNMYCVLIM